MISTLQTYNNDQQNLEKVERTTWTERGQSNKKSQKNGQRGGRNYRFLAEKRKVRIDPGKSKRLIYRVKEVSERGKTHGFWGMKTHSTFGLPAGRGTRGRPPSPSTGCLCGPWGWRVPLSAQRPTPGQRTQRNTGTERQGAAEVSKVGWVHWERLSITWQQTPRIPFYMGCFEPEPKYREKTVWGGQTMCKRVTHCTTYVCH